MRDLHILSKEEHLHKKQVRGVVTFFVTIATIAAIVPHEWSGYAVYLNLMANWLWIWLE